MHMDRLKGILNVALFLVLILIKFIRLSTSTTRDTIDLNHSIADGDVLVSAGGNYALGFFRPGNSDRRYVGIWFNKVTERTVVWVANRDAPLNDTSGVVSFDEAGNNLVLTTKTNSAPLWSTNATATDGGVGEISVAAKLLDSGNLVVIQKGTERVLWQSFDYPSDTWLPFMKLGVDRRTGLNRVLTSWNSTDDPGTGSYSYGIDLTGVPQLFLFKGSEPHWRGGPWNGLRWSGTPELHSEFIRNISFVDSPDETTFTHGPLVNGDSVFSKLVLEDSGFAQEFTWHDADKQWFEFWSAPKDHCDSYGRCGANSYCESNSDSNSAEFECHCLPGFKPRSPKDWNLRYGSGGCVRARGPGSACRSREGFVKVAQVKVPDTRVASVDKGLSVKACEQKCLSDCRCTAYTSANVSDGGNGKGCLVWYGDLMDIKMFSVENEGQDLYVRVDAIELANARKKSSKGFHGAKWIIVTAIVLSISVALLLILFWCCLHRRRSKLRGHARLWSQHSSLLNIFASHKTDLDENDCEGSNDRIELPFFNLREMKSATNNFSNKLGEGGFGAVYKGQLSNGQNIAVKRLSKHSGQGAEEFKNEVQLIAKLQHRNLVKVLGCCVDGEETMLIYEYMPNKSLDVFIFDHSRKALLDWRRRYEIIIGIVQGIIYLHQGSRLRIVHRDLKASNILLDGDMNPKISDFGVARIFGGNQTQASTKRVIGTFGYISPEYALDGLFSTKSDVFSFGVLLLEIITGKKNHALYNDNPLTNLIRHIWDLWNEDRALDIVDSSMGDSWQCSKVLRCIQVGLLCVQETTTDRPTMIDVLVMLSSEATLPSPKKPGFTVRRTHGDVAWATGSSACSRNEITITTVEPR